VAEPEGNFRIRQLADLAAQAVTGAQVEVAAAAATDMRSYRVSCDKFARLVGGFRSRWNVGLGARQLSSAYRRAGLTQEEFDGPRYRRLGWVRKLIQEGALDARLRPSRG